MDEKIKALAHARKSMENAKAAIDSLLEDLKLSQTYQEAQSLLEQSKAEIDELETAIKAGALEQYNQDGNKHPTSYVTVKEFDVISLVKSDAEVRDWCVSNLPGVLRVDSRAFEKVVKAGVVSKDVAVVNKELRAQIKQDLSDWL